MHCHVHFDPIINQTLQYIIPIYILGEGFLLRHSMFSDLA